MTQEPQYYRRNLPHWQPTNGVFHLIPRLYRSLPPKALEALSLRHKQREAFLERAGYDAWERKTLLEQDRDVYFAAFDDLLDSTRTGQHWLSDPSIAQLVLNSLLYWHEQGRYKLVCATVMSNHAHIILYKIDRPLFRITQSIKTYTAKESNLLLGRTGEHFWQRETFDHMIRNRVAFRKHVGYVLNNPVKAKLVDDWEKWPFTWLNPAFRWAVVTPSVDG